MTFWTHVRTAGAVMIIAGAFSSVLALTFIGLAIIFLGLVGGTASLERRMEALEKEKDDAVKS